ncbi:MAG: Lrp/AsnC family transcriptional regulator [Candidatus Odinarchaeota archaeon]
MKPLTETDLKILRALQYNPRISYAELAAELKVTPPTAKTRVESLTERKILKNSYAIYSPEALGLSRFKVLFQVAPSSSKLISLEKALDIHPYTHYRTRFYGDRLGLFSDFDISERGQKLLVAFLDGLKKLEIIESYQMTKSTGIRVSTFPDLNVWNPNDASWQYNWESWEKQLESPDLSLKIPGPRPDHGPFDQLTLQLLSEVTLNADVKQTVHARKYGVSRSTISKKMDFIYRNLITDVWSYFERRYFDLNSYKCFCSSSSDNKTVNSLIRTLLGDKKPPFRINLDVTENGLYMVVNMPTYHESQIVYRIIDHFPDTKILTLDINTPSGVTYPFYDVNYIANKDTWKLTREYVVDRPLEILKKEINA